LKPALGIMVIQGNLKASRNLSEEEWTILEAVKQVLMSFRAAQETLEGESYVEISQVPKFVAGIRLTLDHHLDRSSDLDNPTKLDTHVMSLCTTLVKDLNTTRRGSGYERVS
jgi:hypothetical protein